MAVLQAGLEKLYPAGVGVGFGSDAGHFLKGPLEVERADVQIPAERGERNRFAGVALDQAAGFFDHLRPRVRSSWIEGTAAFAGPESSPFGGGWIVEEAYVFAFGQARLAGGPAVHASGNDGIVEDAFQPRVAANQRLPVIVGLSHSYGSYCCMCHKLRLWVPSPAKHPNIAE